ncbi:MAG: biopolymer transporter ExbD [Bacteroidia bacterium]|jgi:biopolymer transport protein ExbD|nr:biopolymer transporter ExbD [Bacteroidia bacterium]
MKIHRRRREEAEVESSSLNDIMFFLLLFFLIASTLANPNVIQVLLPKATTTSTVAPKSIPLTVTADLKVYIEQEEVAYEQLNAKLSELKAKYDDPKNPDAGLVIVLRLDKDLKVQDMVDVMQVGANLGIKMVLATDKQKQ